jgi:hypothetical protein
VPLVGITTIYHSTLEIHVSKKHSKLLCTGNKCIPLYVHMSKTVGKLVIPQSLEHHAVSWYHHYLQHPGNTCIEETLKAAMYWKQMRSTVRSYVKNCRSCQVNKRHSQKYGKLPTKLVTITPWEAVCVNLIGPYMLRGKHGTEIDFMCLTMIDPASSWFEIVELPVKNFPLSLRVRSRQRHMIKLRKDTLTSL